MKKVIALFFGLSMVASTFGQTTTENYIQSTTYQIPTTTGSVGINAKIETISYFDGLGRPMQATAVRAGGDGQNITIYSEYNPLGRQTRQYLPWATVAEPTEATRMDFVNQATLKTNIENFYNTSKYENTLNPYSEVQYNPDYTEKLQEGAPGNPWAVDDTPDDNHTLRYEYNLNGVNEVLNFSVTYSGTGTGNPALVLEGYHDQYALAKKIVKDENWQAGDGVNRTIETFTNNQGQMLLKRMYNSGIAHDTYYIYDDYGNLAYVLSPEATDKMVSGTSLISGHEAELDKLGYRYIYDNRNRIIKKKVPARDWEYIVYDRLDRVILTQTGNQRQNNQWSFTKYDKFGRVAYTGLYNSTITSQEGMASTVPSSGSLFENAGVSTNINGTTVLYTNAAFPTASTEVLTINYYDTYRDDEGLKAAMPSAVYGQPITLQTKGLLLVAKTKVLDQGKWITSVTGYDQKARPIYVASKNNYLTTLDIVSSRLDFVGRTLESKHYHEIGGGNFSVTTKDFFTYDHMGRPLTHMQQIDDGALQLISQQNYDELGMVDAKKVGGELFESGYTDLEFVDITEDGIITKIDGSADTWNGGLATIGKLEGDGGLSFTMNSKEIKMSVGLNEINSNELPTDVDYGFYFGFTTTNSNFFRLLVNGGYVYSATDYDIGDTFAVERVGNTYYFFHNGSQIYSHTETGTPPALMGDVNIKTPRASLKDLTFYATNITTYLQEVNFKYNVRGWLTDINDVDTPSITVPDLFNFRLSYDTSVENGAQFTAQYNGNIAQTAWNSLGTDTQKRGYYYSYDDLNRITGGISKKGTTLATDDTYDMSVAGYDRNGNITGLTREGVDDLGSPALWDDLMYNYDGNQLVAVTDNAFSSAVGKGFYDGNTSALDYTYDIDGNMKTDANKGITDISYNHLDLPKKVTVDHLDPAKADGTINYVYDATGVKIARVYQETGGPSSTTLYAGNHKYVDGVLQFVGTPEGYFMPAGSAKVKGYKSGVVTISEYVYVFEFKDHLGNIRLSYTDRDNNGSVNGSDIIEENHYYPFGLKQQGYNNAVSGGNSLANDYKFNGIEWNQDFSLNLYEMDVRMYDPAIGRWNRIDPITHYHNSPYNAMDNNPINGADPIGADVIEHSNGTLYTEADAVAVFKQIQSAFGITYSDSKEEKGNCLVCEQDKKQEGQKREYFRWIGNSGSNVTEYYHKGGVDGSKAGWYSENEYFELFRKTIRAIGQGRKSFEELGNFDFTDDVLVVLFAWAVKAYDFYGGQTPEYHDNEFRPVQSGAITPMHFSSPFFAPSAALKFLRIQQGKSPFAFWSGKGTEEAAKKAGYKVLGQTRAGRNLADLTADMSYTPGSQAWQFWGRLSQALARTVPKGGTANVYLTRNSINNLQSIWNVFEKPILKERNVNIIVHIID